jgi:hypothetical protein
MYNIVWSCGRKTNGPTYPSVSFLLVKHSEGWHSIVITFTLTAIWNEAFRMVCYAVIFNCIENAACHKDWIHPETFLAFALSYSLASCSGTSWINMGNLLFWQFTYFLRRNQSPLLNTTKVMSVSPSCTAWRYQFTKLTFALWIVL